MAQWNIGDEVMLNSGGPTMTVRTIKNDGSVYCEWFDGKGEAKGKGFVSEQLKSPSETGPRTVSRG